MTAKELINKILNFASQSNISDVHIASGNYPRIRNRNGDIEELNHI
ncbi:MAG: hypothetical protein LBU14_04815 [Candidatus Peribacteria bacterium]|jgi:Tfp pilus assembly pilus retraction ATPase PilT|nr:hypothetical protein [Candidatus Peribacteria bacterium]